MVDKRAAVTAALAVLAVLALGISAATLDSATTTTDSGGFGAGTDPSAGVGNDGSGVGLAQNGSSTGMVPNVGIGCFRFLTRLPVQLALLGFVALFSLGAYRAFGSRLLTGIFVTSALLPFAVLYLALSSCEGNGPPPGAGIPSEDSNVSLFGVGGGRAGMNAAGEALSTPTALAGLLLVVAILGSVALLFVSTGDDEDELADEEPDLPPPEQAAAVGVAAGEAADRLEGDADLENEVYRAWREMTDLLDVERPASSTPAEFAAAAVEAGMDREDVLALTEVFEEVRYGGADPTPDREERAVAALRHIEETYGESTEAGADG